ncbi:SHSP domain-containing protein [Citrus sinensis]|uniref:SHSP domain-containing protein n=1 Tax=Citrus sinensis TaxID=2711 RepID=A0ACB8LHL1_CITSI|nr:SHSP domain-containing protein [Citrus sinensis]
MSQALSNLIGISVPLSPRRSRDSGCNKFKFKFDVKAQAATGESRRDNFDHLQRANSKHHQPQSKKRVAPVPPVGLWDRFPTARTVQQMMETMERMLEEPFAYSGAWPLPLPTETGGFNSRGRTPWEIKEGENEYTMRFDMPGMTKQDVKVWVEEKMLVVKAQKVPKNKKKESQVNSNNNNGNGEADEEEGDWSAKSYGSLTKITAEVKDGVLYVTIPKPSHNNGRILDINVQ